MDNLKKFIVTLAKHEELDHFYEDMENVSNCPYCPNRCVDILARRPHSRNTHYLLTPEEAELIKKDPRVLDVVPEELQVITRKPNFYQTSLNWDKSSNNVNTHNNWGLLRCVEGQQRIGWGSESTPNQTGSISVNLEGKNVDVVIVDGHFDPLHPEFAVNSDGTGGSRAIQYNWLQHNSVITGEQNGTYVYSPYLGDNSNHGAHVAGTAAGNTQGWARSANLYNISPFSDNPNTNVPYYFYDYIKEFHKNKPINGVTGRANPTIINCSYGSFITWNSYPFGPITRAFFRSVNSEYVPEGLTTAQLNENGIIDVNNNLQPVIPYYSAADSVDVEDLINLGVVVVAAAGNDFFYTCNNNDQDWGNYFFGTYYDTNYTWNYHRGHSPAAIPQVISVGAIESTSNETKARFSNNGPRIDIFAPGRHIMSSVNSVSSGAVPDTRNPNYGMSKFSGTSMACPQVCGVLACAMETYSNMNNSQAKQYLNANCSVDQITDTGGSFTDITSLNGANNKYLKYKEERPNLSVVFPKRDYFVRQTTGLSYPRLRLRKH